MEIRVVQVPTFESIETAVPHAVIVIPGASTVSKIKTELVQLLGIESPKFRLWELEGPLTPVGSLKNTIVNQWQTRWELLKHEHPEITMVSWVVGIEYQNTAGDWPIKTASVDDDAASDLGSMDDAEISSEAGYAT
jgi:hypothetical protein